MTQCFKGGHDYPIEDEYGAYCEEHGVTAIWSHPDKRVPHDPPTPPSAEDEPPPRSAGGPHMS
ncbi:hypothetical protein [Streptomyces montanisoli]|uniref:Uncharacterized protein n=1 Tax=Streptomyces montanisoli TaxID=2798581 RepID=A0A940MHE4_9ACTN|nr:hypothetical protein [Streptomyces montanisoli]MBP0458643.1 hypothetical protein [Streptomyces montanisoli]